MKSFLQRCYTKNSVQVCHMRQCHIYILWFFIIEANLLTLQSKVEYVAYAFLSFVLFKVKQFISIIIM